jgi:predicted nucleic acid-binding protein
MNSNIEFIAPEYTYTEILKHADIIKKKSKLASHDLQYVMDMLFSRITVYPEDEYDECYVQAI